jgi:signal transduction histidine kinase/ligand-binding sensor domain-containing protein
MHPAAVFVGLRSFCRRIHSHLGLILSGVLLLLAHAALATTDALPSYFTRVLRTDEGLPQNSVTAVVQTRDGYLWIGTYNGLARFDGYRFTVFDSDKNNTPQMRSSRVVSLFEDDSGTLWIGHETGELTRYREGKFEAVDYRVPWENHKILSMGTDQAGKLWMVNEEGRLAAITGETTSVPDAGSASKVAAMTRNSRGQIWLVYGGEVFTLTNNRLVSLTTNVETLGGYVTGICAARDNNGLWLASGGNLRRWNGREVIDDLGPTPWSQASISTAEETWSGALAFGTLEAGMYIVIPHRGTIHFDRSNGFPHDWTRCLYEDREGTLWAGTGNGGLVAVRAGKVTTVNPADLWHERDVLSVAETHDGALWVGSEGAGLYRWFKGGWSHIPESAGLSNQFIWSVSEDFNRRLWVGTWGYGIFVQNGERFETPPGLENVTVPAPALLHARDGVTWIGTGAGLLRYQNGNSTWYGRKEGLELPDVRCVIEDGGGGVWFGMMGGGLGHVRDGILRQFHKEDGLSSEYVQCLHLDGGGALWMGTFGGGLNRFKQGRFASLSTGEGLPNNVLGDIKEDDHGNFWFSSRGGIFRISAADLNRCADGEIKSVQTLSYGKGDGMPTLECSGGFQPAGCKTSDGRFWFPTSKGLVVLDPNDAKVNQLPPPVLIEKASADGEKIENSWDEMKPLQIRPGRQRFEFHYTALTFVSSEKVQFRYRLEGLETDWTDAGTKRVANFSYVPPGTYRFRVIACNSDGVWNKQGATFSFVIQPRVWQRWWFRVLEVLVAATVLVGLVLLMARRRMRLKLERLERQRAIERERARIAQDIHDNLGASLTRISLLSQSAYSELDNPPHAATQLDRIYGTARELTRAMDEIVWAVNPQHDTLDSLASYLGKFAQDFLGPLNIRCRLDVPLHLPAWPLTAEVRHNLFLAMKEALHNVVKHASATEVFVSLTIDAHTFTIVVRDNGNGFVPDRVLQHSAEPGRISGGNGLMNMRKRLEKMGGRFAVETERGGGTTVKFTVPVPESGN